MTSCTGRRRHGVKYYFTPAVYYFTLAASVRQPEPRQVAKMRTKNLVRTCEVRGVKVVFWTSIFVLNSLRVSVLLFYC